METLALVLRQSHDAILIPLKRTAEIIGLEAQTLRNRICLGTCPFPPHRKGRQIFFHATDVARYIDDGAGNNLPQKTRRGAPSNDERQKAAKAGLTVPAWRAAQAARR